MKIGETIYLDHQATTPVDASILDKISPYFSRIFANPHSADHAFGWKSADAAGLAASQIGGLIGADTDEIILTSGATEANNLALLGLGRHALRGARNRALLGACEHKSILAVGCALAKTCGLEVEILPVDRQGLIDVSALRATLDDDVLLVSVGLVNGEIGTIQPIKEISQRVRDYGAVFHCDAAQAPMAMDLRTLSQDVDMASLSAHKMYGPKGVGVAYISRDLQGRIEPLLYGGGQQNGLRSGTLPVPLCVGMGLAAEKMLEQGVASRREALGRRRDAFVGALSQLQWPISVNGPQSESRHPGNANVCFHGFFGQDILAVLQPRLAASTGSACTSGLSEPSHVLRAIGLDDELAESCIRFSLGFDTTDSDVEQAMSLVESALERLSRAT